MEKTFTLSVVIPNYNNGRYLEQCVKSIVEQTYQDLLEIIIVDDCSTDNSRDTIAELAKKYPIVKPLLLEKNGRVSAARNAGLFAAKGEYITFVDADDCYYNKEKLANEMALIQKYFAQGENIVAYSSIVRMSNDGNSCNYPTFSYSRYPQGMIYDTLVIDKYSTMVVRDYCVKTSVLREIGGYNIRHSLFEDYELNLKIAQRIRFYYTGEYGTAYRDSASGLSKRPRKISIKIKNQIIEEQLQTNPFFNRMKLQLKRAVIQFPKKIYYIFRRG